MNGGTSDADLHTFSLVTRDQPGVLVRIALVFSRRGFNIESLAVSPGRVEGFARMTVVSRGAPDAVEQITKQLAKLIDVVFVTNHRDRPPVETEVALLKLRADNPTERARCLAVAAQHGGRLLDDTDARLVLIAAGTSAELDSLVHAVRDLRLEELVRSGKVVMERGGSHFAHLLGPEAGE